MLFLEVAIYASMLMIFLKEATKKTISSKNYLFIGRRELLLVLSVEVHNIKGGSHIDQHNQLGDQIQNQHNVNILCPEKDVSKTSEAHVQKRYQHQANAR